MAFGDLIKSNKFGASSATSFTADLGSNPTTGNLLVVTFGNRNEFATVTPPTGFTELHLVDTAESAVSVWAWYYKVSDGTEQTANVTLSGGGNGTILYVEYEWDGSTPTVTKADDQTNVATAVNSQASGSVTPTAATNIVLAAHGIDSEPSGDGGQSMTAGWTEDFVFVDIFSRAYMKLSRKVNAALSSQSATHTDTDTADEMYGAIAVFDSGAASSVTGTFDVPDVSAYTVDTVGAPFTSASHAIEFELSDGTDIATLAGTYNPQAGWAVQEITSGVKTPGSVFENFVGTIDDTSQVYYPTANNTSINATGIITTDSAVDIDMLFWDASDSTWKPFTVLIASDTTPNAFSFTDQIDVALSTAISSNIITVGGIDAPASISITSGEYRINGGAYTAIAGTVSNGDTVQLRLTSSGSNSTMLSTTLDIGGVTDQWDVTTEAVPPDVVPDAFSFTDQTDVAVSTAIESNIITVAGINAASAISISNGEYRVNGGAYTAVSGTVANGDTVQLRLTSSGSGLTMVSSILTIGGVSDQWDITTIVAPDTVPDAFSFTDINNASLSTVTESSTITVTGINTATAISITGGEYQINSGGYTAVSGNVNNGDVVQLRLTSSATNEVAVTSTLDIGGVTDVWSVTTAAAVVAGSPGSGKSMTRSLARSQVSSLSRSQKQ